MSANLKPVGYGYVEVSVFVDRRWGTRVKPISIESECSLIFIHPWCEILID